MREPWQRGRSFLVRNTPLRAREDIAAHYDLGNDLFELMLDETMMYSAAIFERARRRWPRRRGRSWTASATSSTSGPATTCWRSGPAGAASRCTPRSTRGCRVTTTTLSREQRELALQRVREAGLEDRVTVLLHDYRELTGQYDKLVSIEMIEAVGWKDFGTFFERAPRCCRRRA